MRGLPNCPLSIKDLGVYLVAAFFCTPSPDSGIPFPVVWPTLSLFSPAFSAWEQKGSCAFSPGQPLPACWLGSVGDPEPRQPHQAPLRHGPWGQGMQPESKSSSSPRPPTPNKVCRPNSCISHFYLTEKVALAVQILKNQNAF